MLCFIAICLLVTVGWKFVAFLLIRRQDLLKKYGEGTWALVTGSTDGIGLEFAEQLAAIGFNVTVHGRDKGKGERVINMLMQKYPKRNFKLIIADLTNFKDREFIDSFFSQIEEIDISLFVNNAGMAIVERLGEVGFEKLQNITTVNCLAFALLLDRMIPRLTLRDKSSGIINLCSMTSEIPIRNSYVHIYTGTKAFDASICTAIKAFLDKKIDLLNVFPGVVSTKMTYQTSDTFWCASVQETVANSLRCLPSSIITETYGATSHYLFIALFWPFSLMPLPFSISNKICLFLWMVLTGVTRSVQRVMLSKKNK